MYEYHCVVIFGNESKLETQIMCEQVIFFLKSFGLKNYAIEKLPHPAPDYQVSITIDYTTDVFRNHFAQSLLSFCLFHKMAFYELAR